MAFDRILQILGNDIELAAKPILEPQQGLGGALDTPRLHHKPGQRGLAIARIGVGLVALHLNNCQSIAQRRRVTGGA